MMMELPPPPQPTTTITTITQLSDAIITSNSGITVNSSDVVNNGTIKFGTYNQMSLSLLELRIEHHLNRMMKPHRLNNFCNAIAHLPVQSRICEKLLEIMNSTQMMIDRKMTDIMAAKTTLERLNLLASNGLDIDKDDQVTKDCLAKQWQQMCAVAKRIDQIGWAINANKDHIRYVARVHLIPELYQRNEYEQIQLRQAMIKCVQDCTEVVDICLHIRAGFEMQLRAIYSNVKIDNGQQKQEQQQQPLDSTSTATSTAAEADSGAGAGVADESAMEPKEESNDVKIDDVDENEANNEANSNVTN